jgi:hypothetical protein
MQLTPTPNHSCPRAPLAPAAPSSRWFKPARLPPARASARTAIPRLHGAGVHKIRKLFGPRLTAPPASPQKGLAGASHRPSGPFKTGENRALEDPSTPPPPAAGMATSHPSRGPIALQGRLARTVLTPFPGTSAAICGAGLPGSGSPNTHALGGAAPSRAAVRPNHRAARALRCSGGRSAMPPLRPRRSPRPACPCQKRRAPHPPNRFIPLRALVRQPALHFVGTSRTARRDQSIELATSNNLPSCLVGGGGSSHGAARGDTTGQGWQRRQCESWAALLGGAKPRRPAHGVAHA